MRRSKLMAEELGAGDLAVVIPTQNRWDVLERTIGALRQQTVTGFQVVVVVDHDAEVPGFLAGVEVVERHRRGVGAARNSGAAATDRPILMFLGDDTIPDPELVARHLAVHRRHPDVEVGVLGAVHWHPEVARGRLQRWLDWSGTQFDYATIVDDEAGWGRLYSSNLSLKRALYLDVGGFDEEFVFGYEDTELGVRLDAKGFRLLYEPGAEVWHVHRYDWPAIERRFLLVGGGEFLMVRKHPEFAPFFLPRLTGVRRVAPVTLWPWLVDYLPSWAGGLRRAGQSRAAAWYSKRLAPFFVAGWLAARELDELGQPVVDGRYETVAGQRLAEQRWLGAILPLVPPGGGLLSFGCSVTLACELVGSGYRLTFVSDDGNERQELKRRLQGRKLSAAVLSTGELDGAQGFDAALVFGLDRVDDPTALLQAAQRRSSLVAATFATGPKTKQVGDGVLERARGRGIVIDRHVDERSRVVVYRGDEPMRPSQRRLRARNVAEGYARRLLRRPRPPWLPPSVSGGAR